LFTEELHAGKEESKKEKETLTVRETLARTNLSSITDFPTASRKKHLPGGFSG
jgi:hypothetical protein